MVNKIYKRIPDSEELVVTSRDMVRKRINVYMMLYDVKGKEE